MPRREPCAAFLLHKSWSSRAGGCDRQCPPGPWRGTAGISTVQVRLHRLSFPLQSQATLLEAAAQGDAAALQSALGSGDVNALQSYVLQSTLPAGTAGALLLKARLRSVIVFGRDVSFATLRKLPSK